MFRTFTLVVSTIAFIVAILFAIAAMCASSLVYIEYQAAKESYEKSLAEYSNYDPKIENLSAEWLALIKHDVIYSQENDVIDTITRSLVQRRVDDSLGSIIVDPGFSKLISQSETLVKHGKSLKTATKNYKYASTEAIISPLVRHPQYNPVHYFYKMLFLGDWKEKPYALP